MCLFVFAFWYVCNQFTGQGITDAVYYHIVNSSRGVSLDDIKWKVISSVIFILFIVVFLCLSFWLKKHKKTPANSAATILFFIVLLSSNFTNFIPNVVQSIKNLSRGNGDVVADNYNPLNAVGSKKYNYIFIYAESLERTFQNLDGNNYTPYLKEIADKNIEFTDIQQTPGMGWTMAGIVNTQCAIPLVLAQGNAGNNISHFLSGAGCVGSWFAKNNYTTEFIRGSDKEFAGGDKFFSQHGWEVQHDKEYFISNNLAKPDQISGWGVHDDALLEHAYNEYERLVNSEQPFVLSFLTVNTHPPSGTFLSTCDRHIPDTIKNDMLRSVACSDYLLSNFINKITHSKGFENTIIVLVSDHYMMSSDASDILDSSDDSRSNRFVIIKKGVTPKKIDTEGSLIDVWPTVLDMANTKNSSFGFGVSLLNKHSSALIKEFKANGNINDYLDYASRLWELPSLRNKIWYTPGKLNINTQQYNLPFYAVIDNNDNIKEVYFEAFAKNMPLLSMKSDGVFYANVCKDIDINRENVCAYKISNGKVEQFTIDGKGIHHIKDVYKKSSLYSQNLLGISTGAYTLDSGISSISDNTPLKRGVSLLKGEDGFEPSKALSIDTCLSEHANPQVIQNIATKSKKPLIFASNDSAFCGDKPALSSLSSALGINEVDQLGFRQQIIGVYSKDKNKFVIGKPGVPLDAFVDMKSFDLITVCEIFFDCN